MTIAAAAWCVTCGAVPDVAVTVERRGALMHYGACWQHVTSVAERARLDVQRIDDDDRRRAFESRLDERSRDELGYRAALDVTNRNAEP